LTWIGLELKPDAVTSVVVPSPAEASGEMEGEGELSLLGLGEVWTILGGLGEDEVD